MKIENNRRGRLRIGLDADHQTQGRGDPNRFAKTNYDSRHDFHASDVARWDQSETAVKARAFARWKDANPSEYREMNNLHGNAETWFHASGGGTKKKKEETPEETALGFLLVFITGLMWMIGASIPTMFSFIWLPAIIHPAEPHWIFIAIGVVTGFITAAGALCTLFGLVMTIIFAPFALILLVLRALAYPFRSKAQKQKDDQKRRDRKSRQRQHRADKRRKKAIRREKVFSVGHRIRNIFTRKPAV